MCSAPSAGILLATNQAATRNVSESSRLAITQRNVDMLASTSLPPTKQGGHDAIARVETRCQVGNGNADLDWRPIARTGYVHETKLRFHHNIVASPVGVGASLTVAGDGGVDETWVDFSKRLIVHCIFLQGSWQIILHEDVTFGSKFVKDLYAFLVLEGKAE